MLKRWIASVCIAFTIAATAFAQEAPPPEQSKAPEQAGPQPSLVSVVTCPADQTNDHEAEDQDLFNRAMAGFQAASFPGLRVYIPALSAALGRAPGCYPQIERRGDAILVREDDLTNYLALAAAAGVQAGGESTRRISVAQGPNVYGQIAMILGSYFNETRQYPEAISSLDRGLALQPRNQFLLMEKVTVLIALSRQAEAFPILQNALDDPELSLTLDRARFLRNAGVVLIDLHRLDEAEAMLNESIALQPENPIARQELAYIAELRAGVAARDANITAPYAPRPRTQ